MLRAKQTFRFGCLLAAFCHLGATAVAAQGRGLDFSYGRWWQNGTSAELFSLTYSRPWFGPVGLGFSGVFLDDRTAIEDRSQVGGELQLTVGRRAGGLYGIGAGGLAMRTDGGSLNAIWSAGAGYEWRPLSFFSLGGEARYRVEKDEWTQGFWIHDAVRDRKGWQLQARMAIHFGGGARTPAPRPAAATSTTARPIPEFAPPSETDVNAIAMSSGASSSTAAVAASVVQTAIDVMGTPYEWGGTDDNGFDCSGLIQYAYGENGIILPRVSRDQARTGKFVNPRVPDLQPGDILGFSVERSSRITHVGLYIGDGQFIHSSSRGVSISSLIATDASSRWWQHRWIVARRVI